MEILKSTTGQNLIILDVEKFKSGDINIYINCTFGLSLIFEYCSVFNHFDRIKFFVGFNEDYVKTMRSEEYLKSMEKAFIKQTNDLKNTSFVRNLDLDCISPFDLYYFCKSIYVNTGQEITKKEIFYPKVSEEKILKLERYIVINTKVVLNSELLFWERNKEKFSKKILDQKMPIVIIGERVSMKCKEYDLHGAPSFYNEILTTFKNVIDLTTESTEDLYDTDIIDRNLNILRNSSLNVHFGGGGGRIVFGFMNNTIILSNENTSFSHSKFSSKYDYIQTNDSNIFFEALDIVLSKCVSSEFS